PRNTVALLEVAAYTGTGVTRSSGASVWSKMPVIATPFSLGIIRTSRVSNFGTAVPLIQPSKNQSRDRRPSYHKGLGKSSSKTFTKSRVVKLLPAYLSRIFRRARKKGSSERREPFREREAVSESRNIHRTCGITMSHARTKSFRTH